NAPPARLAKRTRFPLSINDPRRHSVERFSPLLAWTSAILPVPRVVAATVAVRRSWARRPPVAEALKKNERAPADRPGRARENWAGAVRLRTPGGASDQLRASFEVSMLTTCTRRLSSLNGSEVFFSCVLP